jgi:antibiotic biosynthesis monooxygenase (ABM) superfamily enzyme
VLPSKEGDFSQWRVRWQSAVLTAPGAVNVEYWPPTPPDQIESVIAATFETNDALRAWRRSEMNAALVAEAETMVQGGIVAQLAGQATSEYMARSTTTEVIITDIKPGKEALYREWFDRIQKAQEGFAGYLGSFVQPPHQKERGWTTVLRFDTAEHLEGWLSSDVRQQLLREGEDLIIGFHAQRVDTSFPGWTPVDAKTGDAPNMWRTACLVLMVLYPVIMLELKFLSPLTHPLPPALGTFIGNSLSVVLTTWPLMQLVIFIFPFWLFPKSYPRWLVIVSPLIILAVYAIEIAAFWHLLS